MDKIMNEINNFGIRGGEFVQTAEGYANNIFGIKFYRSFGQQRFVVYILGSIEGLTFATTNEFLNAYVRGLFD